MPNPMSAAKQTAIDDEEYARMVNEAAQWCNYRALVDERPVEDMAVLFAHHVVKAAKEMQH